MKIGPDAAELQLTHNTIVGNEALFQAFDVLLDKLSTEARTKPIE